MNYKKEEFSYRKPRKNSKKLKKSYISDFMKKNRKEINDRNNKLFREARKAKE